MSSASRRGTGIVLMVVLIVLVTGCLVMVARKAHASRVSNGAQTVIAGTLALEAADAALDEAFVTLGRRANTPGDALYAHLRAAAVPGAWQGTLPVPITLAHLRADPLLAGITIANVRAELLSRRQVGLAPADHEGRVRLTAEAVHGPTGTLRRVTREHTLRVNLLSTPRPFDQLTWAAVQGERLLDPAGNTRIAEAVESLTDLREKLAPNLREEVQKTVQKLDVLLRALGREEKAVDPDALAALFAADRFPAAPQVSADLRAPFHWLPREAVLCSKVAQVDDLAQLDLTPRADVAARDSAAAQAEADRSLSNYHAAHERMMAALRATSARKADVSVAMAATAVWLTAVQRLAVALVGFEKARTDQLGVYRAYEDATIELGGAARTYMLDLARQLDADVLSMRATHRFTGRGAVDRAVAFIAGYTGPKADRGLHAVVFVDNRDDRPLKLDALRREDGKVHLRGKLTLAVTGGVDLENVVLEDRGADLLVVRAGGRLTVRGRVEASLIACDEVLPAEGAALSGDLILAGAFDPRRLHGRLDRDERYVSGVAGAFRGELSQATLSPWALRTFVER